MKVYIATHTPCVYESAPVILSIHLTKKTAQAVVDKRKAKETKDYKELNLDLPTWHQFDVLEFTVKP